MSLGWDLDWNVIPSDRLLNCSLNLLVCDSNSTDITYILGFLSPPFSGDKNRWHSGVVSVPKGHPEVIWFTEQLHWHHLLQTEHAHWVLGFLLQIYTWKPLLTKEGNSTTTININLTHQWQTDRCVDVDSLCVTHTQIQSVVSSAVLIEYVYILLLHMILTLHNVHLCAFFSCFTLFVELLKKAHLTTITAHIYLQV